ncbi:MAG TPA: PilZ domain-containing protein [Dongiaceae bacterium]|nr:PilZ domain-containing protein [Dongiaceae bacterium]
MSLAPVNERRNKLRKKPLRLVYVELAFGNGGMMRDLSEEGFAVRAMMPVRQGDKTPFSFMLGDATRIEGEGKILWIEEAGRVAGVEFLQISPEMRMRIDDWLIEDEKIEDPREAPPEKEPAIAPASTIDELREELRTVPARVEETPAEPDPLASVKSEEPNIASPSVEAEANVEPPVDQEIVGGQKTAFKTDSKPATPAPEPLAGKSSVTDGFFRKWPKDPPSSRGGEGQMPEVALPSILQTPPRTFSEMQSSGIEPELADEQPTQQPLPDISEILIQPHGIPQKDSGRIAATRALPELPEPSQKMRRGLEWFTLRRAVLSMIALTAVAGTYVYHRELGNVLIGVGEAMGGVSIAHPPAASISATGSGAIDGDANSGNEAGANNPAKPTKAGIGNNNSASSLSGASQTAPAPVTPLGGIATPVSPDASSDVGEAEYSQAVQILRGRNASIDTPEAVRLLWIAVEKGNPGAEVTLADLYWHGRGVAQNCDQTRILLTAAARKGNAEAQKRLQQFQREGCE